MHERRATNQTRHQKTASRKIAGKQSQTPVDKEQIGVFTAYTAKVKKKNPDKKTSDGTSLKEDSSCVLANNSLPLGSKISIESIGTCEVHDRIGRKTRSDHFDIHLTDSRKWAKGFGKQRLKYKIVSKA